MLTPYSFPIRSHRRVGVGHTRYTGTRVISHAPFFVESASVMLTFSSGADTDIHTWRNGVVYRTGFRRRVELPALSPSVDLATWLHGLGRVLSKQLGINEFEIDVADIGSGYVTVNVQTPPVAVGRRARGVRGGHAGKLQPV